MAPGPTRTKNRQTLAINKNTACVNVMSPVALSYGRKKVIIEKKQLERLTCLESTGLLGEGEECRESERYIQLLSDYWTRRENIQAKTEWAAR